VPNWLRISLNYAGVKLSNPASRRTSTHAIRLIRKEQQKRKPQERSEKLTLRRLEKRLIEREEKLLRLPGRKKKLTP